MTAPIITIFKNGDEFQNGKRLVLNRKEIRSFDAFLDRVTKDTRSRVAVRSIRTPCHGHRVSELDKLENGGIYVAVGPERFKKLEYKELNGLPMHKPKPVEQVIKPVVHSRVVVSGRARKVAAAEPTSIKTIFVFRNGDDKHPSFKILLDKRILHTGMDTILQFITEKVRLRSGAVRSLFTLDGIEIVEPSQIKPQEKYVAVGYGKKFLKMPYNESGATVLTPRRNGPKVKSMSSEPPHRKKRPKPPVKAMSQGNVKLSSKEEKIPLDKEESLPAAEQFEESNRGAEKQTDDDIEIERKVTQDLQKSRGSSQNSNSNYDTNAVKKTSPVEAPGKKSSKAAAASVKEKTSSLSDVRGRDKKHQAPTERRKVELKKKLKEETPPPVSNEDNEQDEDYQDGEENSEKSPTIFKATGDQGEEAIAVKDNEETTVEKPLDMLPAEEIEEDLDNNDREVPQNDEAQRSFEDDNGVAENNDGYADAEDKANSQDENVEELATTDTGQRENKDGETNNAEGDK